MNLVASEVTLLGIRMGAGCQRDQGMIKSLKISSPTPKPPGRGKELEIKFSHQPSSSVNPIS